MANRIWMEHFGQGIVGTTTNFGVMGDRPSNPQLLEYLASRFIEDKWSMKALSREIMLSSTYQLSYGTAEPNQTSDPDNHLLWRANLRRLDSEELRDSLLFVAGTLDERLGGPGQSLNQPVNKKGRFMPGSSVALRILYCCSSISPIRISALINGDLRIFPSKHFSSSTAI